MKIVSAISIIFLSVGIISLVSFPLTSYSQTPSSKMNSNLSEYFIIESLLGGTTNEHSTIGTIGGVGIYNYFNLGLIEGGNRKGFYGIGIPARVWYSDSNRTPSNLSNMYSIAAIMRGNGQLHPVHESWWMFIGVGPEYRWINRSENNLNLMLLQTEFGVKRIKDTALIPMFEIGFSSSHLFKSHGLDISAFSSFFVRLMIF